MATTQQSMDEDNAAFGNAFAEENVPAAEQTADEAFGLGLPAADDAAAEGDGETDASPLVVEAGEAAAELPAEPPAEEVAAAEAEAVAGDDAMPEMTQGEKSWEGRLRAREAELKALAAELEGKKNMPAEMGEHMESPAEELAESPAEEVAEGGADAAEEAIRQLSEDFGPEFVKMIVAIASKEASKAAGDQVQEVGQTVKDVIDDINNSRARRHFEDIFEAHPDFNEVGESEAFKSWIAALEPEKQTEAARITAGGSAREINRLLSEFKQSSGEAAGSSVDESALDDAEGVRSSGLRLPDAPAAGADDYAAAWDKEA